MSLSDAKKARGGYLIVFGIGICLFALHIIHTLEEGENLQSFLYGIFIPMIFAIGILLGGGWLVKQDFNGAYILRVSLWCLAGTLVLITGTILTILYQQAEGVAMSDTFFVVVNGATSGAVIGIIIGFYDIRQRITRKEADRLNCQLTVLNRVLRHDIRNDANIIQANAELLAEKTTEAKEKTRKIQQRASDLAKLGHEARKIERMLHSTDSDQKKMDITSITKKCCERINQCHPEADINVSLREEQLVYAHPLLESAITNLIENAVKHNEKQTPCVDIDIRSQNGIESVELRIADNGPGISENEISVLERGYETDLEHIDGLGLWLVDWIVTESDGEILFEENSPEGSVVCLRFDRPESIESSVAGVQNS